MKFLSIRWRLVLSYLLLTALTVGILGTVSLTLIQQNIEAQEREYLRANAQVVANRAASLMSPFVDRYSLQGLADTAAFLGNNQVRILDARGGLLADSGSRANESILWIAPVAGLDTLTDRPITLFGFVNLSDDKRPLSSLEQRLLQLLVPEARYTVVDREPKAVGSTIEFGQQARSVSELSAKPKTTAAQTRADLAPVRYVAPIRIDERAVGSVELTSGVNYSLAALTTARSAFLLATLGASLMAVVAGLWVSRSLTAPISNLTGATKRMAQGDLSARAPLKHEGAPRNEAEQLAQQFNTMAVELEASFSALQAERDALRQFISDASHELRTPITALRMSNELLQGPAGDDPAARSEFLAQNEAQLKRLQWITSNLLDLSRMDAGLMKLDLTVNDPLDLAESAAGPFRLRAEQQGAQLQVRPNGAAPPLKCDRARIEMALSNLIDNALKYTPAGGTVMVEVQPSPGRVALCVQDTGIGIPADDVPHVFERFYRARNANAEGSGLGLAIVKSIAQAHGGRVTVESTLGSGSRFTIELPV